MKVVVKISATMTTMMMMTTNEASIINGGEIL